ncbi:conserved hypothetical protein [Stutzerimonas stutzeri A1501]|uniref:Uncharacterized protein n=1 Tax=Stutzerimonas stutzeri (strain A1501) TaxID=379731 RepID=A4VLE6_STUS1|nr:conserved hypothetical protein [Stutzerimonas stutzeri A1501]
MVEAHAERTVGSIAAFTLKRPQVGVQDGFDLEQRKTRIHKSSLAKEVTEAQYSIRCAPLAFRRPSTVAALFAL